MSSNHNHGIHHATYQSIDEEVAPGLHKQLHRQHVRGTLYVWALLTVGGILAGLYLTPILMPHMNSPEGRAAIETVKVFTVAAAPVAALVCAVAIYSLINSRHRSHLDSPPVDGPPLRGNALASGSWLVVSTLLVVFLLFWGLTEWASQQVVHADALQVNVMGQQWLWTYSYPAQTVILPGGKTLTVPKAVDATTLDLPINVPVQFNVTSKDVTHGFWPTQLGIQGDANPGVNDVLRTTPDHLGKFQVRCSQICGLYHAYMYTQASVIPDSAFTAWIAQGDAGRVLTSAKITGGVR